MAKSTTNYKKMTVAAMAKELGIADLPLVKQKNIIKRLDGQIQRKLALEVMDLLNPEDMKALDVLIKKGNGKKIALFLSLKVPNINILVRFISERTVEEFKNAVA